jgi:hypothetical protein
MDDAFGSPVHPRGEWMLPNLLFVTGISIRLQQALDLRSRSRVGALQAIVFIASGVMPQKHDVNVARETQWAAVGRHGARNVNRTRKSSPTRTLPERLNV